MPRATNSAASRERRKKIIKKAKGFFQGRQNYRQAKETVMRGLVSAFRDRKGRKREFRRLWTVRINAACHQHGLSYSRFISGLKKARVELDRKMLADLAARDAGAFAKIVELAKTG